MNGQQSPQYISLAMIVETLKNNLQRSLFDHAREKKKQKLPQTTTDRQLLVVSHETTSRGKGRRGRFGSNNSSSSGYEVRGHVELEPDARAGWPCGQPLPEL